jgi:hypothetical protein
MATIKGWPVIGSLSPALGLALALVSAPALAQARAPTLTQVYGPASVAPGCRGGPFPYCPGPFLPVPVALLPPPPLLPPVAVAPPVALPEPAPAPAPPPLGWVYRAYTGCGNPPGCTVGVVQVAADGLNVRVAPNGPPVMALVNGTPLIPLQTAGNWVLVAAACNLTPTYLWSWTAGVPLNRCWVY